jgi:hypothetical protein
VTAALLGIETVLLVLLGLLVVGLLRSHAEILRRLETLTGGAVPQPPRLAAGSAEARAAVDLDGTTPSGGRRRISTAPGAPNTLLAFLTSGCSSCAQLLDALGDGPPALPGGARLVVVAKDASLERRKRFAAVEAVVDVLMSSQAWTDYDVPGSPYFVYVEGASGSVAGEGSTTRWEQIAGLLGDSLNDLDDSGPSRLAAADMRLDTAGIGPGDPSLYPSRGHGDDES